MVWVLQGLKKFLELRHQEAYATFELEKIGVGAGKRLDLRRGQGGLEVAARKDSLVAFFAEADVQGNGVVGR